MNIVIKDDKKYTIRLLRDTATKAVKKAKREGRSFTKYIEQLILKDLEKGE